MPRPTCRRTPRWDAPVWRCRQQQSRGRYCLGLPWPGSAKPYWGEAAENDCFHPGIRLPKPSAALRAALGTAEDSLGWARGAHEQCANSALFALSQPSCLVCCLPGPGLIQNPAQGLRAIPTIVESFWGWQRRPPFVGNRQAWPPRGAWLPCTLRDPSRV